jgi:hypothetical protein
MPAWGKAFDLKTFPELYQAHVFEMENAFLLYTELSMFFCAVYANFEGLKVADIKYSDGFYSLCEFVASLTDVCIPAMKALFFDEDAVKLFLKGYLGNRNATSDRAFRELDGTPKEIDIS